MKTRRFSVLCMAFILAILALAVGCSRGTSTPATGNPAAGKLQVAVSIVPQSYFVSRIAGDYADVLVMVQPGDEPETYEPKPEQLRALSTSVAYFKIGVPFETAWLGRITAANPNMHIVDTSAGVQFMPSTGSTQGPAATAAPGQAIQNPDPHIWLAPDLVKIQVRNIYQAFVDLDPVHRPEYEANLNAFLVEIDALAANIQQSLAGVKNRVFMVFHPAWGYFAREFDLTLVSIEVGGQEPSAQEMAQIITEARQDQIKVIFAEPQFSTRAAQTIASEIGGKVLLIDPLAYDWGANLQQVANILAQELQ